MDKITEETSTDNTDLTTINQMHYTAALLITSKITPPKPATNRSQEADHQPDNKDSRKNRPTMGRHIHHHQIHQWKHHQQNKEETQDHPQETQDNSR